MQVLNHPSLNNSSNNLNLRLMSRDSRQVFGHRWPEFSSIAARQSNLDSHIDTPRSVPHIPVSGPEQCKFHKIDIKYVCLSCREKICADCGFFGEHKSPDHEIQKLELLQKTADSKRKDFQDQLPKIDVFLENMNKICEEKRKETLYMVQGKFTELRFILNAREAQFIHEISAFYKKSINKLHKQLGEDSLTRKVILKKVAEYQRILEIDDPFDLHNEDPSALIATIEEAVGIEKMDHIGKKLQEMIDNIETTLSNQLCSLERIAVMTEDVASIREEIDLKLDEPLLREEFERYTFSFASLLVPQSLASPLKNDFMKKNLTRNGNHLKISYPFSETNQNLDQIQEIGEEVSSLEFKASKDIMRMNQEEISMLCFIRTRLPNVCKISINLSNSQVSDSALFDIFHCLFWKNDILTDLSLTYNKEGLFEESILVLAEKFLSACPNLQKFSIDFKRGYITNKACCSLNQSLSQLAHNLTLFFYTLDCLHADPKSLETLFVSMQKLESFTYWVPSKAFNDKVLEAFISNTLPSLINLKDFGFYMGDSKVTDLSVKKLFNSFPKEWFSKMNDFRVGLENIKITDESLKDFVYKTLGKFEILEKFEIFTESSGISLKMQEKISQWKKIYQKTAKWIL